MSEENVEIFKRASDAGNRSDIEALLQACDPDVEWHPALPRSVAGKRAVYRGHEGVREWMRDRDEAFAESRAEYWEIRDLGDRIVAIGHQWFRGRESRVEVDSPIAFVVDFRDGKATRVRTYLDHREALEAAGLSE
jgi:ketosteroid isomerase-like protein